MKHKVFDEMRGSIAYHLEASSRFASESHRRIDRQQFRCCHAELFYYLSMRVHDQPIRRRIWSAVDQRRCIRIPWKGTRKRIQTRSTYSIFLLEISVTRRQYCDGILSLELNAASRTLLQTHIRRIFAQQSRRSSYMSSGFTMHGKKW